MEFESLLKEKFYGTYSRMCEMFRRHGELCAARPWEVIIGTISLTVALMSVSLASFNQKVCGWNYACLDSDDLSLSSDRIILTITRCLAVMYIYLQFRNLRKLGSKYLLGIAGIFTIFSSFVFSIAVIHLVGSDLSGLNEALPFFLLLIDLAKASALAKFALGSKSQDDVTSNIGRGMALLGPMITLDALVEILVIGVGTLSGVSRLETMCCFGCMSVLANYLAFMTFYPACLALFMEMTSGRSLLNSVNLKHLTASIKEMEEQKPNPVTQRVKVIMSAGLLLVHAHSHWVAPTGEMALDQQVSGSNLLQAHYITPQEPLAHFYMKKLLSVDYTLTFLLVIVLAFKYIVYDSDDDIERQIQQESEKTATPGKPLKALQTATPNTTMEPVQTSTPIIKSQDVVDQASVQNTFIPEPMEPVICPQPCTTVEYRPHKPSFTMGDSDDDDDDVTDSQEVGTQTDADSKVADGDASVTDNVVTQPRTLVECCNVLQSNLGAGSLTDEEIILLVSHKKIPSYKLESVLGDHTRGVAIRRQLVSSQLDDKLALQQLPYINYDYKYVEGACCENVIGYMPIPVGTAGPLLLDGRKYTVPMATTEGCLVASTNRGCRALAAAGGVRSSVVGTGMTRAPVVRFASAQAASEAKHWLEAPQNFPLLAETFQGSSRFTSLQTIKVVQAARYLYVRFSAATGDAMGMNMVSKGSEQVLKLVQDEYFPDMDILSLSGNLCTDKKPSAINWIEGRGKSVVCDAVIPAQIVRDVLKTSAHALVDLNTSKNLMGSALAASIGGYNAHAANIVTAIYIATGQDPAQNVCSSNCMTIMEEHDEDLYISCTMPSIEVGTVGGGTILPPQAASLQMLGVKGSNRTDPGNNAATLARVVCGSVLAGELSLMSALAAGHLVKSHLKHNRSVLNMAPGTASLPSTTASTSTLAPNTSSSKS